MANTVLPPYTATTAGTVTSSGIYQPANVPSLSIAVDDINRIVDRRLQQEIAEYTAMRTFLAHSYPEVLTLFDTAYATAKRIGVGDGNSSNKT